MVRIVEVGPRDGLQNEKTPVPLQEKLAFIERLVKAGVKEIEATSFVSPKWVPQLADAAELWPALPPGALYSCLVPNSKGLERAISLGASRIAVFTAASETFTQKNINMSISESLDTFKDMIYELKSRMADSWVRGYLSTAFECPYEGKIAPGQVAKVAHRLVEIGVDEVCIGDTIGVAVPNEVAELIYELGIEKSHVAWHFHDTRGTALLNVVKALESGYSTFDSSAGGLGGCPYAPGAGGNLATEDLVYFLERSGIETGIDLPTLAEASLPVLEILGKDPGSKSQLALLSSCH